MPREPFNQVAIVASLPNGFRVAVSRDGAGQREVRVSVAEFLSFAKFRDMVRVRAGRPFEDATDAAADQQEAWGEVVHREILAMHRNGNACAPGGSTAAETPAAANHWRKYPRKATA